MPELKSITLPATLLFLLLTMTIVFNGEGPTEDNLRQMIRLTAASSLALFSLTFSASSLHHFFKGGRWRCDLRVHLCHGSHLQQRVCKTAGREKLETAAQDWFLPDLDRSVQQLPG